jgi:hypothetical protein
MMEAEPNRITDIQCLLPRRRLGVQQQSCLDHTTIYRGRWRFGEIPLLHGGMSPGRPRSHARNEQGAPFEIPNGRDRGWKDVGDKHEFIINGGGKISHLEWARAWCGVIHAVSRMLPNWQRVWLTGVLKKVYGQVGWTEGPDRCRQEFLRDPQCCSALPNAWRQC